LVLGWKEFNGTPHFYSLPQGERRRKEIPRSGEGRKDERMKGF